MSAWLLFNNNNIRKSAVTAFHFDGVTIVLYCHPMCFSQTFETKEDGFKEFKRIREELYDPKNN